jgi:hypothetical protein
MSETPNDTWDAMPSNPNAHWVKVRSLVGSVFQLVKVQRGSVKGRASFIFETANGELFSTSATQGTIAQQIARAGLPPLGKYTIVEKESKNSPSGYSLSLKPAEA